MVADGNAKEPRRVVHTTIRHFDDPGHPLEPTIIGGPAGAVNLTPKIDSPVTITDVTGYEDQFKLETHGFQFVKHKSKFEDQLEDLKGRYSSKEPLNEITQGYYDEMKEFLIRELGKNKNYPKPAKVYILTHITRAGPKGTEKTGTQGPLYGAHVDQSAWAAEGVAHRWLGDEAEEMLKKPRYQIINMWRPIKPITRDPFAVTDAMSIPDTDIKKVFLHFPDHKAEALEVRPSSDPENPHRWYYKHNQHPDDVMLFIQVDTTKQAGVPKRTPHAAFKDPNLDESKGEPRISVETRAMVFYDQDLADEETT